MKRIVKQLIINTMIVWIPILTIGLANQICVICGLGTL